jgi:hypothetical protein
VSDRLVRFPGTSWQEIEALPQPLRWTVQRTIFHVLDEPVPSLADPFPRDDPLPDAYELHLPDTNVTICTRWPCTRVRRSSASST